jgi:hypothetical protein
VRDNGCGIKPELLRFGREGHWGLSGMREKAERIGAKFRVMSGASARDRSRAFRSWSHRFPRSAHHVRRRYMSTITTKDGTEIYYEDWARGNRSCFPMAGRLAQTPGKTR